MAILTPTESQAILDNEVNAFADKDKVITDEIKGLAAIRDVACNPFIAAYVAAKKPFIEQRETNLRDLAKARAEYDERVQTFHKERIRQEAEMAKAKLAQPAGGP